MKSIITTFSSKISIALYGLIGFLFAFLVKSEWDLSRNGNISWNAGYVLKLFALGIFGAIALVLLIFAVRSFFKKLNFTAGKSRKRPKSGIVLLVSFALITASFIPFFLAYFPGICAYDLSIQLEQITENSYNDHHPIFHTLLIKLSLSLTGGLWLYTLIQLLLLAFSLAFIIYTLDVHGLPLWAEAIVCLHFCLNLFNGYMSVSITKDTVFASFLMLFICAFFLLVKEWKVRRLVLLLLSGIGVCIFRNNGKFAYSVCVFALFLACIFGKRKRKFYLKLFIGTACSLIVSLAMLKTVFVITDADSLDKREMLSVPIQQLARTAVYEKGNLTAEEQALIDDFILYKAYENYNPVISDPVKGNTNTYIVRYETSRFVKVYLELLKKYPGDFINAALALIGGYVSPLDDTFRMMEVDGQTVTRNYIQYACTADGFEGIETECSLWPALKEQLDDFALNDGFMKPFIKIFYIPGIYLWIYLYIFVRVIEKRKLSGLFPELIMLAFFGTLLLGPTMHLRYIYPAMTALPAFLCIGRE